MPQVWRAPELLHGLGNIIENAADFARSRVLIQARFDSAQLRIIVEDDGPGIPATERNLVLQRFYRGERARPVVGSGLGLSVVNAIVRLHEFKLTLGDANPGVRAIIDCQPVARTGSD